MGQKFIIVFIIFTFILINTNMGFLSHAGENEEEINVNLQSLTSLQLDNQIVPKNLDHSLLLMKDEQLQEEDISIMSDKDRWEVVLSKTHPYKAKFQYDRVKNRQKSRLIE